MSISNGKTISLESVPGSSVRIAEGAAVSFTNLKTDGHAGFARGSCTEASGVAHGSVSFIGNEIFSKLSRAANRNGSIGGLTEDSSVSWGPYNKY